MSEQLYCGWRGSLNAANRQVCHCVAAAALLLACVGVAAAQSSAPASRPGITTQPAARPASVNKSASRPANTVMPGVHIPNTPASRPATAPVKRTPEQIIDQWEASGRKPAVESFEFAATRIDGESVVFPNDYQGKLVVLMFWATWCPVCRKEVEVWRSAERAFADREIAFLGICTDKLKNRTEDVVRRELDNHKLPWPQIYEEGSRLSEEFDVATIPMVFIVDGDTGEVLADGGVTRKTNLEPCIWRLLERRAGGESAGRAGSQPVSRVGSQPASSAASQSAPRTGSQSVPRAGSQPVSQPATRGDGP